MLGTLLGLGEVVVRVAEVEAYQWPGDTACHARHGRTGRNQAIWGPPGHAYVYLCYGIHHMLNLVTGADGEAGAVLIRAAEPISGLDVIRCRRRGLEGPPLLNGPGKVGAALGLDLSWDRTAVYRAGGLELRRGTSTLATGVLCGSRIGIDYAEPAHRDLPWRFGLPGSRWVSHRRSLELVEATQPARRT